MMAHFKCYIYLDPLSFPNQPILTKLSGSPNGPLAALDSCICIKMRDFMKYTIFQLFHGLAQIILLILCPKNDVYFLHLLHISKCTLDYFYHGSKHYEPQSDCS